MSEQNFSVSNNNSQLLSIDNADHGLAFLVNNKLVFENINNFLNKTIFS